MALWGISTTTETVTNNYAIPKFLSDVDKTRFRHNGFASSEGWTYRHYGDNKFSGLSTNYYDELLVPVFPLSGDEAGVNATGLGAATPVAVFFKDVNNGSPISVAGGSTSFISTATSAEVHLVYNELVYCGAGATVRIDAYDASGAFQVSAVATAASTGVPLPQYGHFDGQVTNRVAFSFTTPSNVYTANETFLTTEVNAIVGVGSTNIYVANTTGVVAGVSSVTIAGIATNQPIVSVGTTFVQIGTASTSSTQIGIGTVVTFSTVANKTNLMVDYGTAVVGTITDFSGTAATKVISGEASIRFNVGGAGTIGNNTAGLGVTYLTVTV